MLNVSSLKNLEHCIADVWQWMSQNLLRLNYNKTNIIKLASPHCAKSLKTPVLLMGGSSITRILLWRWRIELMSGKKNESVFGFLF